jgi:hypothetical protein
MNDKPLRVSGKARIIAANYRFDERALRAQRNPTS